MPIVHLVGMICEDGCQKKVQAQKRMQLASGNDVRFLCILITRGISTPKGFEMVLNQVDSSGELFIR